MHLAVVILKLRAQLEPVESRGTGQCKAAMLHAAAIFPEHIALTRGPFGCAQGTRAASKGSRRNSL